MEITLNDIQLKQLVRESIEKILAEELSISNEVRKVSNALFKELKRGNLEFTYPLFGEIEWTIIGTMREVNNPSAKADGITDPKKRILSVDIPVYNGNVVDSSLMGVLYHEVEHAYQICNMPSTVKSYNILYDKALEVFNDKNSTEEMRNLSRLVYMSSVLEQDALVNELYSALMTNMTLSRDYETSTVMDSNAFKALECIREVKDDITDAFGDADYLNASKVFGKPMKWFLSLARNAEIRLNRKIANVIKKARKDKTNGTISQHINFNAI